MSLKDQFLALFCLSYTEMTLQVEVIFDFIVYADDTTLSATLEIIIHDRNNSEIQSSINKELIGINDWLKTNKLSLNITSINTWQKGEFIHHKKVNS